MLLKTSVVILTVALFSISESGFVDNLPKCNLKDDVCLRDLYEGVIRDIGKTGIPDLRIPPVDPIRLKNVTVSVLNIVNITLIEGVAKGIKDCVFEKFSFNLTEERGHQENTCDITIKGRYKLESASPLVQTLLGGTTVRGEGNGKVKIEKLHLTFDFPIFAQKRSDGEIYMTCLYDLIKYQYKIGGVTSFFADNIMLGDQEISNALIPMLNENSRFVMSAFGQPFIDKAMKEFYFKFAGNFFDAVPAKFYILDDLTPFARP
ncbi:uncharacterized protein LOC142975960 [Anticarsia gemmatalis]|uniref:uncharacterized protein LOC142975960 n=1 Tax=Anticarsia gemmatalis TaxID=129554 RepID=UPI003F7727B7